MRQYFGSLNPFFTINYFNITNCFVPRNMMFDRDYGDFLNRMEDITERKTTLPLCTNIMFSIKKIIKKFLPF